MFTFLWQPGAALEKQGVNEMSVISADDGDRLSVKADDHQGVVRVHINNESHSDSHSDWITLSPDQARALASALLKAADRA